MFTVLKKIKQFFKPAKTKQAKETTEPIDVIKFFIDKKLITINTERPLRSLIEYGLFPIVSPIFSKDVLLELNYFKSTDQYQLTLYGLTNKNSSIENSGSYNITLNPIYIELERFYTDGDLLLKAIPATELYDCNTQSLYPIADGYNLYKKQGKRYIAKDKKLRELILKQKVCGMKLKNRYYTLDVVYDD